MPILVLLSIAALVSFAVLLAGMRAAAEADDRLGLDLPAEAFRPQPGSRPATPAQPSKQLNS
jgi:hypothetical protein